MADGLRSRGQGILGALSGGLTRLGGTIGQFGENVLTGIQQNPEFLDRLVLATANLSQRPNQPLIQMAQANMLQRQQEQQTQAQANRTIDYFTEIGRTDIADVIRANPDMAGQIYGGYVQRSLFPEQPDVPSNVQSYEYYRNQEIAAGRTPKSFEEYQQAVSGKNLPDINISTGDQLGEAGGITALREREAAAFQPAEDSMYANNILIGLADYMRDDLAVLGPSQPAETYLKRGLIGIANFFNVPMDEELQDAIDDVTTVDTATAVVNDVLFRKVQALGGARGVTEVEFNKLMKTVPALNTTPTAFYEVLQTLIDDNNNRINVWRRYNNATKDIDLTINPDLPPTVYEAFDYIQPTPFDISNYVNAGPRRSAVGGDDTIDVGGYSFLRSTSVGRRQ